MRLLFVTPLIHSHLFLLEGTATVFPFESHGEPAPLKKSHVFSATRLNTYIIAVTHIPYRDSSKEIILKRRPYFETLRTNADVSPNNKLHLKCIVIYYLKALLLAPLSFYEWSKTKKFISSYYELSEDCICMRPLVLFIFKFKICALFKLRTYS